MSRKRCAVPGCQAPFRAREMCAFHYNKARLAGDVALLPRRTPEDRFWAKVEKTDSCWLWIGARTGAGYGNFLNEFKRNEQAHRTAWRWAGHQLPEWPFFVLDHLCRNRACVNPCHLEAVSQALNVQRGLCPSVTAARHAAAREVA